jgi:hypothetical protein
MVVRAFAVIMEKSPGVISFVSAFLMEPPALTEVDNDEDAEDDKDTSQRV